MDQFGMTQYHNRPSEEYIKAYNYIKDNLWDFVIIEDNGPDWKVKLERYWPECCIFILDDVASQNLVSELYKLDKVKFEYWMGKTTNDYLNGEALTYKLNNLMETELAEHF
jgi:hypothetical protein